MHKPKTIKTALFINRATLVKAIWPLVISVLEPPLVRGYTRIVYCQKQVVGEDFLSSLLDGNKCSSLEGQFLSNSSIFLIKCAWWVFWHHILWAGLFLIARLHPCLPIYSTMGHVLIVLYIRTWKKWVVNFSCRCWIRSRSFK